MKPILIIGRQGQVAFELRRSLLPLGDIVALDRRSDPAVDLADPDRVVAAVREIKPQLIVNAAAYTAVDRAEAEPELAEKINAVAPGILAEKAKHLGAGLIHYSTDYVFPGDGDCPYREDDPTGPQSVYGRTKLAGEEAIRASGCDHWILRTAWVYGAHGKNFLLTMLRLMREREQIGVVADQHGTPTWSRVIATTTAAMLARHPVAETSGTYHLTCLDQTTWYDFAREIRRRAIALGMLDADTAARITPITTTDYPTPARRPAYSVLDTTRLRTVFALSLPDWTSSLRLCLEEMA